MIPLIEFFKYLIVSYRIGDPISKCLTDCGKDIIDILSEKQICLDGKKLRGENPQSRGNKGLYIVNAWVAENKLCIGQERVVDKSNEIDAIPKLLKEIDITDSVVTIDAMGRFAAAMSKTYC
jgi:hypothetical protein